LPEANPVVVFLSDLRSPRFFSWPRLADLVTLRGKD
jgi:hypothetical protein